MKKTMQQFFFCLFILIFLGCKNNKLEINYSEDEQIKIENISENNEILTIRASDLRNYVGLINQGYHPNVTNFIKEMMVDLPAYDTRRTRLNNYFEGGFGSGFIYVDTDGKNYVITNLHVISQSYSPSISFIKTDGSKTEYEGLKIVRIDEDLDLALLAFPDNQKPFERGLKINDIVLDDGDTVYAAGFPGLGNIPLWQFGMGHVSNSLVFLPKDDDMENTRGPFIQHTAEVDPGNSGGPLLIDIDQSKDYAVVGVNTLKASGRQAANYAIPARQVLDFIDLALGKKIINEQEIFEQRIDAFLNAIKYSNLMDISSFWTDVSINESFSMLNEPLRYLVNSGYTDDDFIINYLVGESLFDDPVETMKILLTYIFLNNNGMFWTGTDNVVLGNIGYTDQDVVVVSFLINNIPFSSEWIKEYGIWRIKNIYE